MIELTGNRWVQHTKFYGERADTKAEEWLNSLIGNHLNNDVRQPKITGLLHFHLLTGVTINHERYYEPWALVEVETPGERDE